MFPRPLVNFNGEPIIKFRCNWQVENFVNSINSYNYKRNYHCYVNESRE